MNQSPYNNSLSQPRFNNNGPNPPPAPKHYSTEHTDQRKHNSKSGIICQICGKTNHSAAVCRHRYDYFTPEEETQQALAAMNLQDENDPQLYVDSGATAHMVNSTGKLKKFIPYGGSDKIFVGNGQSLHISHIGDTTHGKLNLKDILVVPKLKKNLLSVSKLVDDINCSVEFNSLGFVVKSKENQVLAQGTRHGDLYGLNEGGNLAFQTIRRNSENQDLWHKRLGHPSPKILQVLRANGSISITDWTKNTSICVSCQLGKNCKLPFSLSNKISDFPLDKIHCDLWSPAPIASNQGFCYYVLFVDDCTRYCWLFPLKSKSDFFECFLKFQKQVENHMERKIKKFQSDGGGEFSSIIFQQHLQQSGIIKQTSCPYTPQQNGVAERKHRHIMETAITMLFESSLPLKYWVEAILTAYISLINCHK
ncbi:hypothetical protein WN944_001784 [Citrus x changshan-huyou]|uniref:Integrase catalytic domain-containing protein n=1 Tax=Citrus x changshan-huyou TaxID=2935761 RepID=A0AAP0MHX5_9ROSI